MLLSLASSLQPSRLRSMPFENFDFSDFWEDNEYSLREYVEDPPSDDLVRSIEAELGGYRLPAAYIELARRHNGGTPRRTAFPTTEIQR